MLPIGFIETFGIGLEELARTTSMAVPLQEILDIARGVSSGGGVFLKFAADLRRALPGTSWQDISMYYKSARYWSAQRKGIAMYDPDVVIDPALAQAAVRKLSDFDPSTRFRYDIEVSYIDPHTGAATVIYRSVNSERPLSATEATDQLYGRMLLHETDVYGDIVGLTNQGPSFVSMRVTGFYRYSYEG